MDVSADERSVDQAPSEHSSGDESRPAGDDSRSVGDDSRPVGDDLLSVGDDSRSAGDKSSPVGDDSLLTGDAGGAPAGPSDAGDAASRDVPPKGGLARRGAAKLLRLSTATLMAMVGCVAVTLIAMLIGAWTYTQFGPGGLLSEVQVGEPAPDFELAMIDGSLMHLSDYRGRPVALNFWTTWCPGCGAELPRLETAMREHADEGLVVLAVNGGEWPANVESFLEERGIDLPVPLDAKKEVYDHYNINGLPTTIWIDRDGIVRAVHVGLLTDDELDRYASELTGLPVSQ